MDEDRLLICGLCFVARRRDGDCPPECTMENPPLVERTRSVHSELGLLCGFYESEDGDV
jgi:hypothetical protein